MRKIRGITLIEILVSLTIGLLFCAFSWPVLGAMVRSLRTSSACSQVAAVLQANTLYAREYAQADATNAEPRVAHATYHGTAVVFDQSTHKAWFCLNNQRAAPDPESKSVNPYLEIEQDPDYDKPDATHPFMGKKAYTRIQGDTLEHLDLPEHQMFYGVSVVLDGSGNITDYRLIGPRKANDPPVPFAVCASSNGEGMPQRKNLYVDLLDGTGKYQTVATTLPWVLVVPKNAGSGFDTTYLDAVPGTTDQEKLNALLHQAHGQLVSLALGGASKI